MTVVFGLGMRLLVHKRTKLENGVLCNGEQPSSAVNNSFDHGKFEAMKTLSGRIQFRTIVGISFADALLQHTFAFTKLAVFHEDFWATV